MLEINAKEVPKDIKEDLVSRFKSLKSNGLFILDKKSLDFIMGGSDQLNVRIFNTKTSYGMSATAYALFYAINYSVNGKKDYVEGRLIYPLKEK